MMSDMQALLGAERLRRQELAEAEVEKRELLELLKEKQPPSRGRRPVEQADRERNQGEQQTSQRELFSESRLKQREASLQSVCASAPPASPQLRDVVRKGGTRSVTLDCIKRRSREVTVI